MPQHIVYTHSREYDKDILGEHYLAYHTVLFHPQNYFSLSPTFSLNLPYPIDIFSGLHLFKQHNQTNCYCSAFLFVFCFVLHVPSPSLSFSSKKLLQTLKTLFKLTTSVSRFIRHIFSHTNYITFHLHSTSLLSKINPFGKLLMAHSLEPYFTKCWPQMAQPVSVSKMLFHVSFPYRLTQTHNNIFF